MTEAAHLRVSDAEREQAAAAIREHYAAGRLDSAEFEERLQATYSARTQGELDALSSDLPPLPPKPPTTQQRVRQAVASNRLARDAATGGGAFLACTAIWALTGAGSSFWPKWVLVFTLVMIVRGFGRRGRRTRDGGGGSRYSYRYEYHYDYGSGGGHRHEHHHGSGE